MAVSCQKEKGYVLSVEKKRIKLEEGNMNELEKQIKVVAEVREVARVAKSVVSEARLDWESQNEEILNAVVDTNEKMWDAETELRELTLQAYAETGSKSPVPGVGIREVIKLEYDLKVAFDWAKSHKMALKLDTSAFEKIVKATPVDFVKITTEPQATISGDLSSFLGNENVT